MTILLAAGQGSRLRPLTHDRPKTMLNVAGRPMLADTLDALEGNVTIVAGHGQRALMAYLGSGDKFGAKLSFIEQSAQLGPGHAVFQCRDAQDGDDFLVLPGDSWYHPKLIARLQAADAPAMIQVPDARSGRHGVPVVEDKKVTNLIEQEQAGDRATGFCGGAYKMHRRIFEYLEKCNFSMRDAIRMDIKENGPWNLVVARPNEYVDVIEVQDLLKVQDLLMPDIEPGIMGTVHERAVVTGAVHVGEGTIVHAGAIVEGPVTIGKNCEIGPGAVLLPGTSIRNRVRVGALTVMQRCSLASNVVIGSHGRIEDAIIDNGAEMGNYVQLEASTGIIIGADARLGNRVNVSASGVIGRGATVASGRTVFSVPDGGQAV